MAAVTYSISTTKFATMGASVGPDLVMVWRPISKLHFDPDIRKHFPGWFARNPVNENVVFIFKEKEKEKEKAGSERG